MKTGPKRLETKNKPQISKENPIVPFNETLSMLATLYKDKKDGKFAERSVIDI
jgi:hypothetical protein